MRMMQCIIMKPFVGRDYRIHASSEIVALGHVTGTVSNCQNLSLLWETPGS